MISGCAADSFGRTTRMRERKSASFFRNGSRSVARHSARAGGRRETRVSDPQLCRVVFGFGAQARVRGILQLLMAEQSLTVRWSQHLKFGPVQKEKRKSRNFSSKSRL